MVHLPGWFSCVRHNSVLCVWSSNHLSINLSANRVLSYLGFFPLVARSEGWLDKGRPTLAELPPKACDHVITLSTWSWAAGRLVIKVLFDTTHRPTGLIEFSREKYCYLTAYLRTLLRTTAEFLNSKVGVVELIGRFARKLCSKMAALKGE